MPTGNNVSRAATGKPVFLSLRVNRILKKRTNYRFRYSLATLLLMFLAVAVGTVWVRPYFLPLPQWQEFSMAELHANQKLGKPVIVYFRDDWWHGFDQLQTELLSAKLGRAIHRYDVALMVASKTGSNSMAASELSRVCESNKIHNRRRVPAVAVYTPRQSPILLIGTSITDQQVVEVLHDLGR